MLFSQTHTFLPKIFQFGALLGCLRVGWRRLKESINLFDHLVARHLRGVGARYTFGNFGAIFLEMFDPRRVDLARLHITETHRHGREDRASVLVEVCQRHQLAAIDRVVHGAEHKVVGAADILAGTLHGSLAQMTKLGLDARPVTMGRPPMVSELPR